MNITDVFNFSKSVGINTSFMNGNENITLHTIEDIEEYMLAKKSFFRSILLRSSRMSDDSIPELPQHLGEDIGDIDYVDLKRISYNNYQDLSFNANAAILLLKYDKDKTSNIYEYLIGKKSEDEYTTINPVSIALLMSYMKNKSLEYEHSFCVKAVKFYVESFIK